MSFRPDSFHLASPVSPPVTGGSAPDAPTGFAMGTRTDTTLGFTWDSLPEGVTARVMWVQHTGDWDDFIANDYDLTGGSYTVANLSPDISYDVRIRAEKDGLTSEWVTLTDLYTRPLAPGNVVTMTSGYKAVTLQWDTQSGVTFKVYRDNVEVWTGSDHTHVDDTPDAGESYQYKVAAISDASSLESATLGPYVGTSGAGSAPACTSVPEIQMVSGNLTLTFDGIWSGDPTPGAPTLQWQFHSIEGGSFTNIAGEVTDTYYPTEGIGFYRCAVTRTNVLSSTTAYSNEFLYDP